MRTLHYARMRLQGSTPESVALVMHCSQKADCLQNNNLALPQS